MGLFGIKNAFNQGLDDFKRTPNALLVDVRTPQEYAAGHVPGSVNLPVERIDTISWGTDRPLFVYCLSGARSGRACAWLKGRGYRAVNIGGISSYRGEVERN
jgi:phage shock protein E